MRHSSPAPKRVSGREIIFRVGTWNVHEAVTADSTSGTPCNLNEVVRLVNEYRLDILALQEVDLHPDGSSAVLRVLCDQTELRYQQAHALSPSSFRAGFAAGLAIASRFAITSRVSGSLRNPIRTFSEDGIEVVSHDKGVLWCTIDLSGITAVVGSFHAFPFYKFDRSAEDSIFAPTWRSMSKYVSKFQGTPLLLCGDFNTPRRDLLIDISPTPLQRVVGDIRTYRGFAADDILASPEVEQANSPTIVENFSDHKLCIGEFAIRGGQL